jgi:hypothetical protein
MDRKALVEGVSRRAPKGTDTVNEIVEVTLDDALRALDAGIADWIAREW